MAAPIKRNKNLVTLSHDHHTGLLFCWKIRQGLNMEVDAARIVKYAMHFWEHNLKIHFTQEENTLFVLQDDGMTARALAEHEHIKSLIETLPDSAPDRLARQLSTLADRVDDHIRFEERELFPHLEQKLAPQQLLEIGKRLNSEKHLHDFYPDQFWIRN
jgi:hemerythrin-like domain-containing protein